MIAFLDAEFNCGASKRGHKSDSSLIDVAVVVLPDRTTEQVVATYQAYCQPLLNNGRLYPIIRKLTHIRQEDVDHGKTFAEIFADLQGLIKQYEISEIYVWGNFDKYGLSWNCKMTPGITNGQELTDRIVDISRQCQTRIGVSKNMSLENIAFVCDCVQENHHTALADTEMLAHVVVHVFTGQYDQARLQAYDRYVQQREAYYTLRKAVDQLVATGADLEDCLQKIKRDEKYPQFQ